MGKRQLAEDSLGHVAEIFLKKYKPSSRKSLQRDILPMVEFVGPARRLRDIKGLQLVEWVGECVVNKGYATTTQRTKIKAVKTFFNWCAKHDLVTKNPATMLDLPQEVLPDVRGKAYTPDEADALIAYAAGETTLSGVRLRDWALFAFCHDTGVRVGSLEVMRRRDVDLDRRRAIIQNTKRQQRYVVVFGEYAAGVLRKWFAKLPNDDECYLWNARQPGRYMSPHAISQIPSRACALLGIPKHGIHGFRRAVGVRLADNLQPASYIAGALNNSEEVAQKHYMPRDIESAHLAVEAVAYVRPSARKLVRFKLAKAT